MTDQAAWAPFDLALAYYQQHHLDGIGFVFVGDGFCGVHLDDCRDPKNGALETWAAEVLERLQSYAELSPSGTGVKVFTRGLLPDAGKRAGSIEVYQDRHYFTVTGRRLKNTPMSVQCSPAELLRLYHSLLGSDEPRLTDKEILSRAERAVNGDKFTRLWAGNTAGYDSLSEADLALCGLLGFWTGGDPNRVEDLFGRSALGKRRKWTKCADYRERTVRRALEGLDALFTPVVTRVDRVNKSNQEDTGVINTERSPVGEQGVCMALELAQSARDLSDWVASFRLARRLRRLTDSRPEQFEQAVRVFCEKTGRAWESFWYDFLVVWDRVRSAEGDDPLAWAASKAKEEPYPHIPCSFGPLYVTLASLSWHLSRLTGGKPFFLPRERIAELCGVSPMSVSRVVTLLERANLIKCVLPEYSYIQKKSKEYVFTGPAPQEEGRHSSDERPPLESGEDGGPPCSGTGRPSHTLGL